MKEQLNYLIQRTILAILAFGVIWSAGKMSSKAAGAQITLSSDGNFYYMVNGVVDTSRSGLVQVNKKWYYLESGQWMTKKYAFVDFGGSKFLVANGVVATDKMGLMQDPENKDDWYFVTNGQVTTKKSGLVQYPAKTNNWFFVENGKLDTTYNGFVSYDGGLFFVARGKLQNTKSGLTQDPNNKSDWYFLANGQAQLSVSSLVLYDDAWFYVVEGKLVPDYTGIVKYNGESFRMVNGVLQTNQKVIEEEEVTPTIIEVVNPIPGTTLDNISQEMADLLNAKRGELGFPQTVEVIPESETYLHDVMKQGVINLGTIEFSHEVNNGLGNGLNLLGSVIGKSTIKDSTNMFNSWMSSPGHYSTLMPTDTNHLHSDDVLQIVCYVYGPVDGYYYYELNTRLKAREIKKEEWQEPYINPEQPASTPGVSEGGSTPGATVDTDDENGYIDNYGDEIVLDSLIGTDAFWKYFENCSPELQEHYRKEHPELFN